MVFETILGNDRFKGKLQQEAKMLVLWSYFLPHYLLLIIHYSLFLQTIQDLLFPLIFPEILLVFMRIELVSLQVCYSSLTC